jgi:DNA-binding NarL/FixJ family response regulator
MLLMPQDSTREMNDRTVVLAEPITMIREGLAALLESRGYHIMTQCSSGLLAWEAIQAYKPRLAILDANLSGMLACEILKRMRQDRISAKVIVLSTRQERNYMLEMFRAGADAYLLKSDRSETILDACHQVLSDRYFVSPVMQNTDVVARDYSVRYAMDPLESLSNREYQIFSLLIEGVRAKEIAHRLSLSPKTIDTHRASLMRKLDIHDVPGLVKYAISRNLINVS